MNNGTAASGTVTEEIASRKGRQSNLYVEHVRKETQVNKVKAFATGVVAIATVNHHLAGGNLEAARRTLAAIEGARRVTIAKLAVRLHARRVNWAASDIGRWSRKTPVTIVPGTA